MCTGIHGNGARKLRSLDNIIIESDDFLSSRCLRKVQVIRVMAVKMT